MQEFLFNTLMFKDYNNLLKFILKKTYIEKWIGVTIKHDERILFFIPFHNLVRVLCDGRRASGNNHTCHASVEVVEQKGKKGIIPRLSISSE